MKHEVTTQATVEIAAGSSTVNPKQPGKGVRNLIGQRFGKLVVLGFWGRTRYTYWKAVCDCGNETKASSVDLTQGHTKSCGCLRIETTQKSTWVHGCASKGSRVPEYKTWTNVKNRIQNPNNQQFHLYGGRGIKICEGFLYFPNFIAVLGRKPSIKHGVDRIDNDANYSCGECEDCREHGWVMNVRWATNREQANNRRSNWRITINGETFTATQWAQRNGLSPSAVLSRLNKGWNPVEAVTMSAKDAEIHRGAKMLKNRKVGNWIEFNGQRKRLTEWAKEIGIHHVSLKYRIKTGWPMEKAMSPNKVNSETRYGGARDPRVV